MLRVNAGKRERRGCHMRGTTERQAGPQDIREQQRISGKT